MSRSVAASRVARSGRVAASGRVVTLYRNNPLLTLGSALAGYWIASPETLTIVSGKVSQISDLSGNARHLSQATSSKRPSYNSSWINSAPSLTFSGGHVLRATSNAQIASQPWTLGGVFQSTSNSSARCAFAPCSTGGAALTIDAMGDGKREIRSNGVANVGDGAATTNPEAWIATGIQSASVVAISLYVGGVPRTLSSSTVLINAPGGAQTLMGGISTVPLFAWVGEIGELFILNRVISQTEMTAYLSYVNKRYGI